MTREVDELRARVAALEAQLRGTPKRGRPKGARNGTGSGWRACTHKTARDFSCGEGIARVWRCSFCGVTSRWAEGWAYHGNVECRRCWAPAIESVACPACAPKEYPSEAEAWADTLADTRRTAAEEE